MRLLVTGATALIGSTVCARAVARGNRVVAAIGPGLRTRPAGIDGTVEIDIARATAPADWNAHLQGIDAVVNCACGFQSGPRQLPEGVHHEGVAALCRACSDLQVLS